MILYGSWIDANATLLWVDEYRTGSGSDRVGVSPSSNGQKSKVRTKVRLGRTQHK
jgi:hypothetical protein